MAEQVGAHFPDGVGFIDLAPIEDPCQVVPTIARRLGAPPAAGRSPLDVLRDYLAWDRTLLVLDNIEHLLDAAPDLAEVLTGCPFVKLIVTSRAALHLRWEHRFEVSPLGLPDLQRRGSHAAVARAPAVSLFVDRARAVEPSFSLTSESAPAVAELCVRLDGLPLAIELAARHIKTFPPALILRRFTESLGNLTPGSASPTGARRRSGHGPRDLPARQQTLEAAVGWSYALLPDDERALFRRLAIFEGGFAPEAAAAVCADVSFAPSPGQPAGASSEGDLDDVHGLIMGLVDHSLVARADLPGQPHERYRLLETIRQYAAARLAEAGEAARARTAHRDWCLRLVERADPELRTGSEPEWLPVLDAEHENVRAALAWSEARDQPELVARLVAALWWYWHLRGLTTDAHHFLTRALVLPSVPSPVRAKLLNGAAVFAYDRGEYARAEELASEALVLSQQVDDARGASFAQASLGFIAYFRGEYDRARALLVEALARAREIEDPVNIARALNNLGVIALARGDMGQVSALFEESLAHWRQVRSDGPSSLALLFLGRAAHEQGDHQRATSLLEESVALARRTGYARAAGPALHLLGRVEQAQGRPGRAAALFRESLAIRREQGDRRGFADCFEGLAEAAEATRKPEVAARLLGAADALRLAIGAPPPPYVVAARERVEPRLRRRLGRRYDDAVAAGAGMATDAAIRFALAIDSDGAAPRRRAASRTHAVPEPEHGGPAPSPTLLSPREREVSMLVARGLSNRDIAAALVVTEGSAANYVKRILAKLGFRSRAQVAAWAARIAADGAPAPPPGTPFRQAD